MSNFLSLFTRARNHEDLTPFERSIRKCLRTFFIIALPIFSLPQVAELLRDYYNYVLYNIQPNISWNNELMGVTLAVIMSLLSALDKYASASHDPLLSEIAADIHQMLPDPQTTHPMVLDYTVQGTIPHQIWTTIPVQPQQAIDIVPPDNN